MGRIIGEIVHESDDINVKYREFAEELRKLRAENISRSDEVKGLIVTQIQYAIASATAQHTSMNQRLSEQNTRLDNAVSSLSTKIEVHTEEDRAVERRVWSLEQSNKQLLWIVVTLAPAMIAVWEGVKKLVGWR